MRDAPKGCIPFSFSYTFQFRLKGLFLQKNQDSPHAVDLILIEFKPLFQ